MTGHVDEQAAREALGDQIATLFLEYADPLGPELARELEPLVDVHMEAVHEARTQDATVNVRLADELAGACKVLLKDYEQMDDPARAAVVGAVRYFIQARDADNDLRSPDGLHDDALVMNHVIRITGAPITPIQVE